MPLFDRYIAVDWSANDTPKLGKDSIWIGEASRRDGAPISINLPTRAAAMMQLMSMVGAARDRGERVVVGFDFAFGYPQGAAEAISGTAGWRHLWTKLASHIVDGDDNRSNRFAAAGAINLALEETAARYWGHPWQHAFPGLTPKRPPGNHRLIPEQRRVESRSRGTQPVWKLSGAGAVGSQSLLGIPRLNALRNHPDFAAAAAIWPFETGFADDLARPVLIAEIFPSILPTDIPEGWPRDRAQVEACATRLQELDAENALGTVLSGPRDLGVADRDIVLAEEGWIVGVGHENLFRGVPPQPPPRPAYLREPNVIYEESFAIIRHEAELSHLPGALHDVAIRMIHACGMVDLAADIVGDAAVVAGTRAALHAGAPVFCDAEMVAAGIIRRYLPRANEVVVTLGEVASAQGTTRSAAAVELWRNRLGGAIVVIGNAPTALFRLLELIEAGAPRPAAIIAAPVGFVGAAESKALLAERRHGVPFITVAGRRGGSAIASAAFNAIAKGATP